MSAITIENDLIHYEVLGRGKPVILVHGWLGSWRYWVPTMQQLSIKFRIYAVDLWGFGDSGKESMGSKGRYGLPDQVQLLHDFMERLGIAKAALVGHSFGAAVCLSFARKYPDRAPRMMLISPPFEIGSQNEPSNLIGVVSQVAQPAAVSVAVPTAPPQPVTAAVSPSVASQAPITTPANPPSQHSTAVTVPITVTPPPQIPAAPLKPAIPTSPTSVPTTPPVTPAPVSATGDTLPRNPLRALGDTPEEILAKLGARNLSATTSQSAQQPAGQPTAQPAIPPTPQPTVQAATMPPAAPPTNPSSGQPNPPTATNPSSAPPTLPAAIPISSGTPPTAVTNPPAPIAASTPAATSANVPTPATRNDNASSLIATLTSTSPIALLNKYVDRDAPDFDKLRTEVEKTDATAVSSSAQSLSGFNMIAELIHVKTHTLLLHGEEDRFLRPPDTQLQDKLSTDKLLTIVEGNLRHFPMLEMTAKFNRLLIDFLESSNPTNVAFREQWRRIVR